jgi:hypothetical protein
MLPSLQEGACNGAANARFSGTHGSWRFRCPRSFYRVADDWNLMPAVPPWDLGLLDLLVRCPHCCARARARVNGIIHPFGRLQHRRAHVTHSHINERSWL